MEIPGLLPNISVSSQTLVGELLRIVSVIPNGSRPPASPVVLTPNTILPAQVTQVQGRQALLQIGSNAEATLVQLPTGVTIRPGQTLTVQPQQANDGSVSLRVLPNASQPAPTDYSANASPTRISSSNSAPVGTATTDVELITVVSAPKNGRVLVEYQGREVSAQTSQPLQPGSRYLVQVRATPQGIQIQTIPAGSLPNVQIATALVRSQPAPQISQLTQQLAEALPENNTTTPTPKAIQALQNTLQNLLPQPNVAPSAESIQRWVDDGGTQYEAKLAQDVEQSRPLSEGTDLKGALLRYSQSPAGSTSPLNAAVKTFLEGIESLQAGQSLAQQSQQPIVMQVPFLDGTNWRTLRLAIEPDEDAASTDVSIEEDSPPRRLWLKVPLESVGPTWIEVFFHSERIQATFYLENVEPISPLVAEMPELRQQLQEIGFADVGLRVRTTQEMPARQQQKLAQWFSGLPEQFSLVNTEA